MPDVPAYKFRRLAFELGTIAGQYAMPDKHARSLRKAATALHYLEQDRFLHLRNPHTNRPFLVKDKLSVEESLDLAKAGQILAADIRTQSLAVEMGRLNLYSDLADVEPWRWLRAATILTTHPKITDAQADSFEFLKAIARSFRASDREAPFPRSTDVSISLADIARSLGGNS